MKVLLIAPPDQNTLVLATPSPVNKGMGKYPPLGLLYVAAACRRHTDAEVAVIDAVAEQLGYDRLAERIRDFQPDIVGIQAMTFTLIDVCRTAQIAKQTNPSAMVVVGGPHTAVYPVETLDLPNIDAVVVGEGETSLPKLVRAVQVGASLEGIAGVYFRRNGRVVANPRAPLIENLDDLAYPARELIRTELYQSVLSDHTERKMTTIMGSRGCPMRCIFCDRPQFGKTFRQRSAGNILDEMQDCLERFGIREFVFYDDTFSLTRPWIRQFAGGLLERKLEVVYDIRVRVDVLSDDCLELLARSGCRRIHVGVESGDARVLRLIRKGIDLATVARVVRRAKQLDMETLGYFMLGLPGETEREVQRSLELALKLPFNYVQFAVTSCLPGTRLYEMAMERGICRSDVWREYARNPRPDFVAPVWTEYFTREQLWELARQCYRRFYFRPRYILQRLRAVSSPAEFAKKARTALSIFRWSYRRESAQTCLG